MNNKYIWIGAGLLGLLLFLTGCGAWNTLIKRNLRDEPYDEFAEMNPEEIAAFNTDPANDDKIICETEKPTGSNIPVRTCRWQSEMRRRAQEDQKAMREMSQN